MVNVLNISFIGGERLIDGNDLNDMVSVINGLAAGTTAGVFTGTFVASTGSGLKTDTVTAHTAVLQAYDVNGTAYKTFATLTNGDTPTFTIAAPSGGTVSIDGAVIGGTTAAAASVTTLALGGTMTIADATNIAVNATTGTKIGTATSQKLAFYNSTPVVQPAGAAVTTAGFTAGAGAAVLVDSTFTGNVGSTAYHISDIVANLKSLGLLAA